MKKFKNLVIGGIENKIFNLILITVILLTAAFMAVSAYHNRMLSDLAAESSSRQQSAISGITSQVMETVVDRSMGRSTQLEAQIADELFNDLKTRVEMLGDYAQKLFSEPEKAPAADCAPPDASLDGQAVTQLFIADGTDENDAALGRRIGIAANMSEMMVSLFGVSEETNSCFIGLPEGVFLIADDRSASKFDRDGSLMSYDPRTRPWYVQAAEKGQLIFTDVETDAFTGDIGIVCAMPVYVNGRLEAVVGSDLFLSSMQAEVQASEEDGGYVFVVNQNGHVVFSPKTEGLFSVKHSDRADDLRHLENRELSALVTDALNGQTDVRLISLEDGDWYMTGAPLKTVGWALVSAFSRDATDRPAQMLTESCESIQQETASVYEGKIRKSRLTLTVLVLSLALLTAAAAVVLGKKIVKPLNSITRRIAELKEGNLEFKMEPGDRTGDEIELLAESFASLSHKTVEYIDQVRSVTAEKERVATELHMANQIQESMLPGIFPPFPDRKEFDIYATMQPAKEVGGDFYDFFLIDDDHLCLVMADVSGKGIPAALFMMASKIIIQSCAMLGKSAAEILKKTNEAICSNNKMEMFVTVWLGILEISTGKLTAANAGHEYPYLKKGVHFELYRDKHGFVIGALDSAAYREYTIELQPGDAVFVYTDGVPEANDAAGQLFGTDRLLQALNRDPNASCRDLLGSVKAAVDEFVQDAPQFDDTTMLALKYLGNIK